MYLPTVVLPAPWLAVGACSNTPTLLAPDSDDDTRGERRPPTAGSRLSEALVARTSYSISVVFIIG